MNTIISRKLKAFLPKKSYTYPSIRLSQLYDLPPKFQISNSDYLQLLYSFRSKSSNQQIWIYFITKSFFFTIINKLLLIFSVLQYFCTSTDKSTTFNGYLKTFISNLLLYHSSHPRNKRCITMVSTVTFTKHEFSQIPNAILRRSIS